MKKLTLIAIGLMSFAILMFQNCSMSIDGFQVKQNSPGGAIHQEQAIQAVENGDVNSNSPPADSSSNLQSPAAACAARTFSWIVAGKTCSVSTVAIPANTSSVIELTDNVGTETGKVSVKCINNGTTSDLQIQASPAASCAAASPVPPPSPTLQNARTSQMSYEISGGSIWIYTGAYVTESIYICIESPLDTNYPCVNGDLSRTYEAIARPTAPKSQTQELTKVISPFALRNFGFGKYSLYLAKKDSQNRIDTYAQLSFSVTLSSDRLFPGMGGTYTSTAGPVRVEYKCPVNEDESTIGFLKYEMSNQNCYYRLY